jgi:branched-subunit amino acid aminotransferase/4-amino-4-deoxychorismate lyase
VLYLEDLYKADEVFITSTTRELLPVHQIQDRPLAPPGAARPVMQKLQAALTGYLRRYTADAKRAVEVGS